MASWLLKTEPGDFSFADLVKQKRATWDGVRNAAALINIRQIKKGDELFIYHTGDEKAVVGIAKALTDARPPTVDSKEAIFDLASVKPLAKPVTLAAIKADGRFSQFGLVKITRLSAMPVPPDVRAALLELAGAK